MASRLSQEEENYVRMSLLLTGISPRAARTLFDQEFVPSCLVSSLKKEYNKLKDLQKRRVINQSQWNLLFPRFPDVPDSKTFDVTLIITLLRNLTDLSPPRGGYDQLPSDNEITPAADLARIKYYRNVLAHLDEGKVDSNTYTTAWDNVTSAISRLGGQQMKQECDDLKVKILDQTNQEIMLDIKRSNGEIMELKKSVESLKRSKKTLTVKVKKLKTSQEATIPWNIRAQISQILAEWKDNDQMFITTEATKHVLKCVKKNSCVTITASSGVGKTAILRHVALQMEKEGYDILLVTDPGDIVKFYNPKQKTLFVLDDLCGNYSLNQTDIKVWEPVMERIKSILSNTLVKILAACRLQVYQDDKFESLSIFKTCVCNLLSNNMCLSKAEKESIAELYLKTKAPQIIEFYDLYYCFPLLCKLYHENPALNITDFFLKPFTVYEAEIDKLQKRGFSSKYCALALCVMFNNNLNEEILTEDMNKTTRSIIENTCEACKLDRGTSRLTLQDELNSLTHTFLKKEQNKYKTIHDKIFDFLVYYFGQKIISCLIKNAHSCLIMERFLLNKQINVDQFITIVPPKYHDMYMERMIDDWSKGEVNNVFCNINMNIPYFRQRFLCVLNKLDVSYQKQLALTCDVINNDTALFLSCFDGDIPMINWCINNGVDVNQCRDDETSPLNIAAQKGWAEIVRMLLDIGADYNKCDNNGWSPVMIACRNGYTEIVRMLLDIGADYNKCDNDGWSPVNIASSIGHTEIVRMLLDIGADYNKCDNDSWSPVMSACRYGHTKIVRMLLDIGADYNKCDHNGWSPVISACRYGHTEIVKMLLDIGADYNKCDNDGWSPVMCASSIGHIEIMKILLDIGADYNICNNEGKSAIIIASKGGHFDIVNMIEEHSRKETDNVKMTTPKDESDTVRDDIDMQGYTGGKHEDPDLLPFAGTSEDFRKLLSTGTYESFENRVFLCGSCACGKSTLASVLIGTPIPLTWKSTDGLVIHFGRNGINLESFEMVPLKEEDRGHNVLTKLVIGKPNREITKCQTIDNQHDLCFASSSNDLTELNPQDSEIDANFSSEVSVSTEDDIGEYEVLSREQFSTSEMNNTSSISLPNVKTVEAYAVHDDILKEVESGQYKVKIAPSDLVDFGGQRSYDMTHQLFVQHGGTFVVMFDGSRDFQKPLTEYPSGDISNETIVKHWVNSILTYCVDDNSVMPKILFAATHRDILSDDMQKKKNREFVQRVTEMFGSHEMNKHIVFNPVFFINGTDKDDQEIQNLKNHIVTIARQQPSWGLRRPIIWVPIELMIDNMIKDNINIIPKTYLVEANTMNKDLALSDKQMSEFLLTQHALGKIMYFDQAELNNFIILYPPALVNILRSFITDEMFWPNDETLRSILRRMTETGKIHKTDLIKLWQQKQFVHHIPGDDYKEFIIQVLVHLDILVLPKRYSGHDETHVDYFLVPCTVKHKMPMFFLDDKSFANRTIALVYHIRQSSIPSALSFKLIGAVSGIWPIKEVNERPLLYHSSAVLCVDSQTEFRIMVEDNRIVVYLTNMSSRSCISPDIAASIQDCLTVTLQAVLKFYLISIGKKHQQVNVSNLFHIEVGDVCCRSPCVISISKAKQTHEWVCNNGNTHFSRDPLLWIFNKTHQECSFNCPGLDESVLTMSPSEQHLSRLAYQLNIQSCRELIINLGIQLNDWEDIEYRYTRMPLIIKIMALNFWKTKNIVGRPNKSFNTLLDALKAVGDTRHLLCKVFREYTHLLDIAYVRLQEVPDDDVLQGLPKYLGNCAIPLGIELGISVSSIEETMTRHPRDMYNQISDILRKWKSSTCSREVKPTIYKLMLALERVHTGGLDYLKDIYLGQ